MMMSPPRPVSVPPTDVARRNPRAVSSISVSEFLNGPIRVVGNARSIPGRFEHGAEVVGVLFGKVAGIADADDAARRVMPEDEGRKGDRGRDRFQRPRRHVDDQPPDLAAANALEPPGDRFDVPSRNIGLARRKGCEDLVHEGSEIVAQAGLRGARASDAIAIAPRHRASPAASWPRPAGSCRYCARIS